MHPAIIFFLDMHLFNDLQYSSVNLDMLVHYNDSKVYNITCKHFWLGNFRTEKARLQLQCIVETMEAHNKLQQKTL